MFSSTHPERNSLFDFYSSLQQKTKAIISIPHSGEEIPEIFLPYLSGDEKAYLQDTDYKVHELIDIPLLQKNGIAVLVAKIQRVCVDLNRKEDMSVFFWKENTQGKKIVIQTPSKEIENQIIEIYYRPYYEFLKAIIQEVSKQHPNQKVPVIDLHSMPSKATSYHLTQNPNQKESRPDFCLSDRRGQTCSPEFIDGFKKSFDDLGHVTTKNDPYIGGNLTEYINKFFTNNIQIEINRSLYMDEKNQILDHAKAENLKNHLTQVFLSNL